MTVEALEKSGRRKIGFFGAGKSNMAVLDFLKDRGLCRDIVFRFSEGIPDGVNIPDGAEIFAAECAEACIDEDALFLSPSVRRDKKELTEASRRGVILSSDIELFFEEYSADAIGVTGSDGKSTTTYLISSALSDRGALPVGNFGIGAVSAIDRGVFPIVELSSFQLTYSSPRLLRGVITNITENHLNWHRDFEEYASAKMKIAKGASQLIYDYDSKELRQRLSGERVFCITSLDDSYTRLRQSGIAENIITAEGNKILLNGKEFLSIEGAIRKERYNIRNYMLAIGACLGLTDEKNIKSAILSFRGLPHRAEIAAITKGGIRLINSSIDTSPARTLASLKEYTCPLVLILDGRSKGADYGELLEEVRHRALALMLCGEVGRELYSRLRTDGRFDGYSYKLCADIDEALSAAVIMLRSGGAVLYSPSGTSFDRFKNFEERGAAFRLAAEELCHRLG